MAVLDQSNAENLALIEFHGWWPGDDDPFYLANVEENEGRINFYPDDPIEGGWYVPRMFFDGFIDGQYLYDDDTWPNMITDRNLTESPLEMTLDFDFDGTNGTVHAHITAEQTLDAPNVVIHFVLTESEIAYEATNGSNIHHNVMRKMYPDGNGEPFTIQGGQHLDISRDFTLDPGWMPEHCGFVVFVQDNATFEVIQATKSRILTSVSVIEYDLIDSGGDGDGNFEQGESVDVTFSVRNYGPLATGVSATLTCDDPDVSILTSDVQLDDIPLNGTVDNTTVPLVFQVSQDVEVHFTDITITLTANGGQVTFEEEIEILVGKPNILIVNDDHIPAVFPWDYNAEGFYKMALYDRDETYHVWNTTLVETPGADVLLSYDIVIWFTGASDPTITPEDEAVLTAYLDAGGNLIISGQDIASDLQGSSFLSDYLHAEFVADSSSDIWLNPTADPITGELSMLSLASGDYGAANQDSPDEIAPLGDAMPILTYYNSGRTAALRYMNDYRLVYFAFGFESLVEFYDVANSFNMRADFLQRIFDWFEFEPQIGDVNENGNVDIIDVVWVVNIVLGTHQPTPGQAWAADVNEDGAINIIDAIVLVNIILGG
ncbi:MAG: Omp28-related outer membrane protein [Gemmatimonadota bacterium]|nr:MAG: Omp28-related outer membrane protein [Gemmatimonadota bacterium]